MSSTIRMKLLPVLICMMVFACTEGHAAAADSLYLANDSTGLLPLPPLDTLITWALLHSPLMHEQEALIEKNKADPKRIKKLLLDAVKFNTGFQYGNYGDPTENRLLTGYASGISISFSLHQLLGQKNNMQVFSAEKKVSEYKKDEIEMDVEKLVTMLYNNAQAQKAILKIRSEGSYSAYTHASKLFCAFRSSQYSRILCGLNQLEVYRLAMQNILQVITSFIINYAIVGRKHQTYCLLIYGVTLTHNTLIYL